jgi:TrmH family RNA methyltransferase
MLDKNTNIGKIKYNGKYIALENVSNPSNFGAVVRTAEAVGLDGVIVSGGCDIYNPKSQRSAMGSLFRLNIVVVDDLPQYLTQLKVNGMKVYAGVPDSNALKITQADMSGGVVSIIGNEGNGIGKECAAHIKERLLIPSYPAERPTSESLNVSTATAIICAEFRRR